MNVFEESARDSYKHLKIGGELVWVVQKHVTPLAVRLIMKQFGNYKILAHGKDRTVLKAYKG